jgi:hypothetical protein
MKQRQGEPGRHLLQMVDHEEKERQPEAMTEPETNPGRVVLTRNTDLLSRKTRDWRPELARPRLRQKTPMMQRQMNPRAELSCAGAENWSNN